VAERVGFVHARDAPKARRGLTEDTLDAKTERSEGSAERVGFEPHEIAPLNNLRRFRNAQSSRNTQNRPSWNDPGTVMNGRLACAGARARLIRAEPY
jgi:hypothetical protein